MSHIDITFNWRATMGNAAALPADVVDYLDLVAGLAADDGFYQGFTANRHTCAADDPIVILDHVRRQGLCSSVADYRLYDKALASVRQHRKPFFCDAEIERRMKEADGNCPMCGFVTVFHSGEDTQGYRTMMTHCQHNLGHRVKPEDVEAYLRRPSSWQGRTWPYGYMAGNKLTHSSGEPYAGMDNVTGRTPCLGCLEMEADERIEAAFKALITTVSPDRFSKPGWGSPLSEYHCPEGGDECTACGTGPCNRSYMRVKRVMKELREGFGDSKEVRLNGAGLKLYIRGARASGFGHKVTSSMRVGGDQVNEYPGFQQYAHELFSRMGVPQSV